MLTADDITVELQEVFKKLKSGEIKPKEATEMINATGKMISIQKTQLAYQMARGEKPEMQFFASSTSNDKPAIESTGNVIGYKKESGKPKQEISKQ